MPTMSEKILAKASCKDKVEAGELKREILL